MAGYCALEVDLADDDCIQTDPWLMILRNITGCRLMRDNDWMGDIPWNGGILSFVEE